MKETVMERINNPKQKPRNEKRETRKLTYTFILFAAMAISFTGCRETKSGGEKVEDAIEEADDDIEEGAEDVKDAVDDN